jgi:hypothetical protein
MKQKYYTYTLTGRSIKQLREDGLKFWTTWHEDNKIENIKSHKGKVSIPKDLFLPNSNNKTFTEQKKMIKAFHPNAFMGNVADYCELAYLHLQATGEYLFGEKYDYSWARTTTTVGTLVADVGVFDADRGLDVHRWGRDGRAGDVFASPLVANLEIGSRKLDTSESLDIGIKKFSMSKPDWEYLEAYLSQTKIGKLFLRKLSPTKERRE